MFYAVPTTRVIHSHNKNKFEFLQPETILAVFRPLVNPAPTGNQTPKTTIDPQAKKPPHWLESYSDFDFL